MFYFLFVLPFLTEGFQQRLIDWRKDKTRNWKLEIWADAKNLAKPKFLT